MVRLFRDRCRREGAFQVCFEIVPDLLITAGREHMDTLFRDIIYSLRGLARNPGFALMTLATLALGIGANTAIFSVVKNVLLDPLPYREPGQLVELYEKRPKQGRIRNVVSVPDYLDWKDQSTVFEDMAAASGGSFNLAGPEGSEFVFATYATTNYFHVFGVTPQLGRDFLPEEAGQGHDHVVILDHGFWKSRFGADPKIVGQTIQLTGESYTVIGILPEGSSLMREKSAIWKPMVISSSPPRGAHFLDVYARMKPGVSLAQARAEMDAIGARLEREYANENTGHGVNVFMLEDEIVGSVRPALLVLLAAVGLVLLVGCANVANLYLVRTSQRRREISIRRALGSGTMRMVRQLLTESLLVSLLGGAAGVALAYGGVRALVAANPGNLPRISEIQIDGRVLLFSLAISVFTGLLFALAPAVYSTRANLVEALKEGGRGGTDSRSRARIRSFLVVGEIALALVLVVGAGLMLQSFERLTAINPGFDSSHVLAVDIALSGQRYSKAADRVALFREYLSRVRALPGVISAGATNALPLAGRDAGSNFLIEGKPPLPYSQQPNARFRVVSTGYFETMRIPLRAGRLISSSDAEQTPHVAVVNSTFERLFFPDGGAAGKRIILSGEKEPREIVGIVADVKHYALDGEVRPEMYFPFPQEAAGALSVVLRTTGNPEALAAAARERLAQIDKALPVVATRTMDEVLSRSVAQPRLYSVLIGIFSAFALVLAAVGIYGVMSFVVGQRTHEMGVRMALGARAGAVQSMVLKEGLLLAGIGVAIGLVGAFALTRLLGKLLYDIAPNDPLTLAGSSMVLVAVAAAACYVPARRATQVDPIVALRCE